MSDPTDVPEVKRKRPPPTNPTARLARFLNKSFPKTYATLSLPPRLATGYGWLRKLERAGLGKRLSELSSDDYKTSETVFVLATGSSINDYPKEYWEVIREGDSIGMNFFLLHEHVPTLHVMESVTHERRRLLQIRYAERRDYAGTRLILKTQLTNLSTSRLGTRLREIEDLPPEARSNIYLSLDVLAAGRTVDGMESSYRLSRRLGLWKPQPTFLILTKRRGSVSYIVNLAVRAGYRRIVLCGVDLNHAAHFYDRRRRELESAGMPVPNNREEGAVHGTNDPAADPVTIQHVLRAIKKAVLDPAGIELLVGSETSALHPEFPRFDWERAIADLGRPREDPS